MGGGLMQLVAYGAQDIYLTGNPQITFFKVVYRRHTNFSMEAIEQSASGVATVGQSENEASFTISRNGDLIYKVYLTADVSEHLVITGSKIIKEVEISIGGQKIDRYTQEWQDIWNELTTTSSKSIGLKSMIGDIGTGSGHNVTSNKSVKYVQIPLLFWFCRNPGLALPLIALQYHEVKIDFTFDTLINIGSDEHHDNTPNLNLKLFVDYIYLDTDERRRFAQVSHEYLIEQLQILETNDKIVNNLNLNHPVKEIIWTSGNDYGAAQIKLNGHDRFSKQKEEYFQLRQPFDYHTSIPHHTLPTAAAYTEITSSFIQRYSSIDSNSEIKSFDYTINQTTIGDLANTNFVYGVMFDNSNNLEIALDMSRELSSITETTLPNFVIDDLNDRNTRSGQVSPPSQGRFLVMAFKSGATVPNHPLKDIFIKNQTYDIVAKGAKWVGSSNQGTTDMARPQTFKVLETKDIKLTAAITSAGAGVTTTGRFSFSGGITDDTIHFVVFSGLFYDDIFDAYTNPFESSAYIADYTITEINEETIDPGHHFEASTSQMTKKINVYSFSLKPEEHQPSGTCNFSRIDTAQLITDTQIGLKNNIYAVNYNVLRIMSGMGGLAYSN